MEIPRIVTWDDQWLASPARCPAENPVNKPCQLAALTLEDPGGGAQYTIQYQIRGCLCRRRDAQVEMVV